MCFSVKQERKRRRILKVVPFLRLKRGFQQLPAQIIPVSAGIPFSIQSHSNIIHSSTGRKIRRCRSANVNVPNNCVDLCRKLLKSMFFLERRFNMNATRAVRCAEQAQLRNHAQSCRGGARKRKQTNSHEKFVERLLICWRSTQVNNIYYIINHFLIEPIARFNKTAVFRASPTRTCGINLLGKRCYGVSPQLKFT